MGDMLPRPQSRRSPDGPPQFQIRSAKVDRVANKRSRVALVLANNRDPKAAPESIELSIVVSHDEIPLIEDLQVLALRRAQE